MKTSRATVGLFVVLYMSMLLCGCYGYHTVVPVRNIPAGAVIQESDLRPFAGRCWELVPVDYATDRSQVIGRGALNPIRMGGDIHEADISPFAAKSKLAEW